MSASAICLYDVTSREKVPTRQKISNDLLGKKHSRYVMCRLRRQGLNSALSEYRRAPMARGASSSVRGGEGVGHILGALRVNKHAHIVPLGDNDGVGPGLTGGGIQAPPSAWVWALAARMDFTVSTSALSVTWTRATALFAMVMAVSWIRISSTAMSERPG